MRTKVEKVEKVKKRDDAVKMVKLHLKIKKKKFREHGYLKAAPSRLKKSI